MKRFLLIIGISSALIICTNAQNYNMTFTVRQLQHGQGPLLQGVKIDIDNGSYLAFTNSVGTAVLSQVPAGTHTLRVSKPGYIQFTQNNYQLIHDTVFDACILPKTQIGPWGTNEFDVAKYKATYVISTGGWGNLDPPHWAQIAPIENRINNASAADSITVQQAIDQIESMSGYDLIILGNYPEESSYTINMNTMTDFSQIGTDEFGTIFVGYSNLTPTNQKRRVIHEIVMQFDMNPLSYYIYPSVMDPSSQTQTEMQPWDANHIAVTFDEHYAKQRGEQDLFIGNMEEYTAPVTPEQTTITQPANNAVNLPLAVPVAWNNIAGSDKYHLNIATDAAFSNLVYDLFVFRKDTFITLLENTTYHMRVRCENTAGISSWSAAIAFTTLNTMPGSTAITLPVNNAVNVPTPVNYTWTPAVNATKYNLEVSLYNTFTPLAQDVTVYDIDTVLALNGNRTYYNRVRGESNVNNGPWSETVSFSTLNNLPQVPVIDSPTDGLLSAGNYQNGQLIVKYTSTAIDIDSDPITTTLNVSGPGVNETFITSQDGQVTQEIDSALFQPDKEYIATINATDNTDVVYGNEVVFKTLLVGLDASVEATGIILYPNPCDTYVNIQARSDKSITLNIEIYDGTGRRVENVVENFCGDHTATLDLSNQASGIYLIKIKTNKSISVFNLQLIR